MRTRLRHSEYHFRYRIGFCSAGGPLILTLIFQVNEGGHITDHTKWKWTSAGITSDKTYVTNANPLPFQRGNVVAVKPEDVNGFAADDLKIDTTVSIAPIFETVLSVGCISANGFAGNQTVLNHIWPVFQSLHVENVQGKVMSYWGPVASQKLDLKDPVQFAKFNEFFSVAGLVGNLDGRCEAWAGFFVAVLAAQGIDSVTTTIDPGAGPIAPIDLGGGNIAITTGANDFSVNGVGQNDQGSKNPKQHLFVNHVVVQLAGNDAKVQKTSVNSGQAYAIFDPSYGGNPFYGSSIAAAEKAWELGSIGMINWIYNDGKIRPAAPDATSPKPEMSWLIKLNIAE